MARDAPGPGVALRLDSVDDCYLQNVVVVLQPVARAAV